MSFQSHSRIRKGMDMMFPNLGSINRNLALLVLLAVLPALGLLLYTGMEQRHYLAENARQNALRLAQTMAEMQEDITRNTRLTLSTLALLPEVRSGDLLLSQQVLQAVLEQNPTYQNFTLTDLNGDVLASGLPFRRANLADRKHFRDALAKKSFAIGEFIVSRVGEVTPALPFAYPVLDDAGQPVYILTAAINLDIYQQLYDSLRFPENSFVAATDHKGLRLLYHPPRKTTNPIGKPIKPSSWQTVQVEQSSGLFTDTGSDGIRRIFAFHKMFLDNDPVPYIYLWAGIPEDSILEPANAALIRNVLLMFLATALALVIAFVLGRKTMIQPINNLMDMTREFADGNLAFRNQRPELPDEFGKLTGAFHQMADALQTSQASLRKEMSFSKSLIDAAQAIILVLDKEGRIEQFNPYMEEVSGYRLEEVKGRDWITTFLPQGDHAETRSRIRQAANDVQIGSGINPILTKTGQERQIEWDNQAIKDLDGNIVCLLAVGHDITETLKAEEALRKLDQAKSDFITTVAHELRTPLTSIYGFLELMEDPTILSTDEQRESYLAVIRTNTEVLIRLVDDLMDIGCIQIDHSLGIELTDTDPAKVIKEAVASAKAKSPQRDITISHTNPLPATLPIDAARISQILNNLLSNAIKYSAKESPIELRTTTDQETVSIAVQDQGIGMKPDQVAHIFDKFYRAEGLNLRITGLGLGMTIVKQIVEDHGGEVEVASCPGKGTTVTVRLPRRH